MSLPGGVSPLPVVSQYADDTSLIVVSDDSIKAVFDTYAVFELGSGSKLNLSKSKGLWLGGWSGRLDPPITLEWTSGMIKVLGVFIGIGDLEEANWRPRITAVKNTLNSWRQRHLSYRGRALIINALALSRIWYVASLVHMPDWVLRELNTLAFNFFWKGKKDLVTSSVVCQPFLFRGFSVVSIKSKVWALHVQWARRLVTCPASWVHFLYFYFWDCLGASPLDVLSRPSDSTLRSLPPFYRSFLSAWRAVDGSLILPGKLHMEFFTLLIVLLLLVTLCSCLVFVILRLNLSIIFSSNALLLSLLFLGFNPLCFVGLCLLLL